MDLEELYRERCKGPHGQFKGPNAMAHHLPFLKYLVTDNQAMQVVELGVHTGQSTVAFLLGLEETGGCLWSVDRKIPLPPIDAYMNQDNWTFILGDTRWAVDMVPPGIDILFIDADLQNRLVDLELYGPKVRSGGFILVHDLDRPEVAQAVSIYMGNHEDCDFQSITSGHGLGIITC